jgi:hypothetical protein
MGIVLLTNASISDGITLIIDQLYMFGYVYNRAHALGTSISSSFMNSGVDTLTLTTQVDNPNNRDVLLDAVIMSMDSTYRDTIPMFDDGAHGDVVADDGLWGAEIAPIDMENVFSVGIGVTDLDSNEYHFAMDAVNFTTIGPITCENFTFLSPDTVINPGDTFTLRPIFKNAGTSAAATNLSAEVTCSDPNVSVITPIVNIGDIDPGQTKISSGILVLKVDSNCPGNLQIQLDIVISSHGSRYWNDTLSFTVLPTGIADENKNNYPIEFALSPGFPNPFNPKTTIRYAIPKSGKVIVTVFNTVGQEIETLVNEEKPAGNYEVEWNAVNFPSGIYMCQLNNNNRVATVRLILLK